MVQDRLQLQRMELKHIVDERLARKVRVFVRTRLELDAFAANCNRQFYLVHSLYLN